MVRVAVIVGLAWAVAGCGGGSPDRAQDPRARPTHTAAERVLTASDVDVLPPSGGAGFPGGTVACEAQVRRMLLHQARHGRTRADREGARVMLREISTAGELQSGCATITIPLTARA